MPMPLPGETFPAPEWSAVFDQYELNGAFFGDDQAEISRVLQKRGGNGGTRNRGDDSASHFNKSDGTRRKGGVRGWVSRFFNGRVIPNDENRTRIHAPVASNLARLSADLLTSEPPVFRLIDAKGEPVESPAQERVDAILNGPDQHRALSEAAETCAGLGAVALTAHWDPAVSDRPWMESTPCDAAIPEYRGRRLVAVNLYTIHVKPTEAMRLGDEVYLHVERHEVGVISHALYRVKQSDSFAWGYETLGDVVPLNSLDALAHILEIPGSRRSSTAQDVIELPTGIDRLTVGWWRNLPTKAFRKILPMIGRADFEGVEQLLDAIDEVWSSWMRDIKIARARLIVPESMLEFQGAGLGGKFDEDREILTALQYVDLGGEKNSPIEAHQFEIRAAEHAATLLGLTREITQFAGYSLSSYGERSDGGGQGGAITATEVTSRTTMTERTRGTKFGYLQEAAHPLALAMLDLDRIHYRGPAMPQGATLTMTIPPWSQLDPEKEARMFQYLRAAMAVSTDTLVRMQHDDWDETRIRAEVEEIQRENGLLEVEDPAVEERVPGAPNDGDDELDEQDPNLADEQQAREPQAAA
jgi:hypothetical protein